MYKNLASTLRNGMNYVEHPFDMGMFYRLKVSFNMGTFSDSLHTHPGIFILESPPPPRDSLPAKYI